MHPYCGEYIKPCPIGKRYPLFNSKIPVAMPFLTNSRALIAGELLVLPYDGGSTQICSLPPPLDVQAHISQQSTLSTGELSVLCKLWANLYSVSGVSFPLVHAGVGSAFAAIRELQHVRKSSQNVYNSLRGSLVYLCRPTQRRQA